MNSKQLYERFAIILNEAERDGWTERARVVVGSLISSICVLLDSNESEIQKLLSKRD